MFKAELKKELTLASMVATPYTPPYFCMLIVFLVSIFNPSNLNLATGDLSASCQHQLVTAPDTS